MYKTKVSHVYRVLTLLAFVSVPCFLPGCGAGGPAAGDTPVGLNFENQKTLTGAGASYLGLVKDSAAAGDPGDTGSFRYGVMELVSQPSYEPRP
jgi:hypothetical protein